MFDAGLPQWKRRSPSFHAARFAHSFSALWQVGWGRVATGRACSEMQLKEASAASSQLTFQAIERLRHPPAY